MISFFRKLFGSASSDQSTSAGSSTAVALAPGESDLPGFVRFVTTKLVDSEQCVTVESERDDLGVLIHVTCSDGQAGRVIGRKGKTISAIQGLVRAANAGKREKTKVIVND